MLIVRDTLVLKIWLLIRTVFFEEGKSLHFLHFILYECSSDCILVSGKGGIIHSLGSTFETSASPEFFSWPLTWTTFSLLVPADVSIVSFVVDGILGYLQ